MLILYLKREYKINIKNDDAHLYIYIYKYTFVVLQAIKEILCKCKAMCKLRYMDYTKNEGENESESDLKICEAEWKNGLCAAC